MTEYQANTRYLRGITMKFFCELKKAVDDSYDIEIGRGLSDTLISDIKNGLCGRIKKFAVVTDSIVEPLYAKGIY